MRSSSFHILLAILMPTSFMQSFLRLIPDILAMPDIIHNIAYNSKNFAQYYVKLMNICRTMK